MIDDLFDVVEVFIDEFKGVFWTGAYTGPTGYAFEWFDANIGLAHGSNGAEADTCLAADADVFIKDDCPMFVSGKCTDRAHVEANSTLVAHMHFVALFGFDDADG